MTYREAAERSAHDEPKASAVFRVHYRSRGGLLLAAGLGLVAAMLAAVCARSSEGRAVVVAGTLAPSLLAGFAVHVLVMSAAEVDLRVTAVGSSMRVVLLRRWGFFTAAPLIFSAAKAPQLETSWDEGRSTARGASGRRYKHARLALSVGGEVIRLPTMRGPRELQNGVVVIDHAPEVLSARERYRREVDRLRAEHDTGSDAAPPRERRTLVGSTDGASGPASWLGVLAALVVTSSLVVLGIRIEAPRPSLLCSALALPMFGALIAIVATASAYGRTLHFRRADGAIEVVRDYLLFGPMLTSLDGRPRVIGPRFSYRITEVVSGEDDAVTYELVVTDTGETLMRSANEDDVRRYAKRLGGRSPTE